MTKPSPTKIPRSHYPRPAENRAVNTLLRRLAEIRKAWLPRLKANTRRDDRIDDDLFDQLQAALEQAVEDWLGEFGDAGREAFSFMRSQFARQFRAAYGADPLLNEPWAAAELDEMIRSVRRRCRGSIADAVGRMRAAHALGRRRGRSPADIDAQVGRIFDTLEARHRFAIRDELTNMIAATTQRRHEAFGIVTYIWRDRRDKRVRGNPGGLYPNARHSHWHRNGLEFRYDDPPEDGNPGEPEGCRCVGEPVFPALGRKEGGWLAWLLAGLASGAAYELSKNE